MRTVSELLDRIEVARIRNSQLLDEFETYLKYLSLPAEPLTGPWADFDTQASVSRGLDCAKGCYQERVVMGRESISGSTQKGRWGSANKRSRTNLLKRMREAGLIVTIERLGKRDVLCVRKGGVSRETP